MPTPSAQPPEVRVTGWQGPWGFPGRLSLLQINYCAVLLSSMAQSSSSCSKCVSREDRAEGGAQAGLGTRGGLLHRALSSAFLAWEGTGPGLRWPLAGNGL